MSRFVRWVVLFVLTAVLIVQIAPRAEAATITDLNVQCNKTTAKGKIEVQARYVRAQVALASDLSVVLASDVFRVKHNGSYAAQLRYPRQPEGTLLIVAIGEWDGQQYVRPATMTSGVCHGGGTPPIPAMTPTPWPTPTPITDWPTPTPITDWPTPTPITDWPTPTPITDWPTPTPITDWPTPTPAPFYWNVTTTLTNDTCGGAAPGSSFSVAITPPDAAGNISLQRFDLTYYLYPAGTHPGYIGQLVLGDATTMMDLFFTGPATFTAYEHVTFASIPGCFWMFEWQGSLVQ